MTQTLLIAVVRMSKNFLKLPGYSGLIVSYMTLYQFKGYVTESQALSQTDDERFVIEKWGKTATKQGCRPISPDSRRNCEYHSLASDDPTDRIFFPTTGDPCMPFYTLKKFETFKPVCLANLRMSQIPRAALAYTRFDDKSVLGESPVGYYLCQIAAKVDERGEEYVLTSDEEVCFRLHASTMCWLPVCFFVEMFLCLCVLI